MKQNCEAETMLKSFMYAIIRDSKAIRNEIDKSFEDLSKALEIEDYHKAVESAAEIMADCGSIVPLQNLQDSVLALMQEGSVN